MRWAATHPDQAQAITSKQNPIFPASRWPSRRYVCECEGSRDAHDRTGNGYVCWHLGSEKGQTIIAGLVTGGWARAICSCSEWRPTE